MFRKIKLKNGITLMGFALFCIAIMFEELFNVSTYGGVKYIIWILSMLFIFFGGCIKSNGLLFLNRKILTYLFLWIIFIGIYLILYNQGIFKYSFYTTLRWLFYFSFMLLLPLIEKNLYLQMLNILKWISEIYVAGVYFFMFFPEKYKIMYTLWGYWPSGTNNGKLGFHAGFANHYSENAMFITVALFVVVAKYMLSTNRLKKKGLLVEIFIVAFALMSTTKRAHILFGVLAIICAYYLFKPEKRITRSFKITIAAIVGFAGLYVLSFSVPEINAIFERFSNIGEDEESNTRFLMWALALKNFKNNPIFGIGWNGYKYLFNRYLYNPSVRAERYAYLNAHNVYLQLLCETGILGFSLFMTNAVNMFIKSVGMLKANIRENFSTEVKMGLFFILTMQIFFWLYSMTGNCLYDVMFAFYAISIGFLLGYLTQKNRGEQ